MKSTEIIQPVAMATPIAVTGSKDTIPQEQTSAQEPWFCSIEKGFPDITMQALNQGGRPPRGQGMNALLNMSSDQKVYLQNGGTITFDENVSNVIGGYPQGAVLDYISGNNYLKVISLIDDNTVNFITEGIDNMNWRQLDIGSGGGTSGANTDLSNLTDNGNAKFQFAPFSINNGAIDANGQNATVETVGNVPITVNKYIIPVMSSNSSTGVSASVSGGNQGVSAYKVTNSGTQLWYSAYGSGTRATFTFTLASDNYIPAGAVCNFTLTGQSYLQDIGQGYLRGGCVNPEITLVYSDNTSEAVWSNSGIYGNNSTTTWTPSVTTTKEVKQIILKASTPTINSSDNARLYCGNFTMTAQYTVSTADTLICNPCTITTADGKYKNFTLDNILDCSGFSNGVYKIMKSYTDGSLTLFNSNFYMSKLSPVFGTAWTQPVLSANGTMGGESFAVSDYNAFDNVSSTNVQLGTSTVTDLIWYNPEPLNISSITIKNRNESSNTRAITAFSIYGSTDGTNWVKVGDYTNSVTTYNTSWTTNITGFNYKYGKLYYNDYAGIIQEMDITATTGTAQSEGDLWLDCSQYPLALKEYNGTNWVVNNDLVYIGDVTISSGVITAISNVEFNKYGNLLNFGFLPDYSAGVSKNTGTAFTVNEPSLLEIKTYYSSNGSEAVTVTINSKTWTYSTPAYSIVLNHFWLNAGDSVTVTYTATNHTCNLTVYPLIGG